MPPRGVPTRSGGGYSMNDLKIRLTPSTFCDFTFLRVTRVREGLPGDAL